MKTNPSLQMLAILTPEVKSYASAVLMATAYAQTMREKVNTIHREILTECQVWSDRLECRGMVEESRQIFESKDLYLCSNDALCKDFYAEANKPGAQCIKDEPEALEEFEHAVENIAHSARVLAMRLNRAALGSFECLPLSVLD